MVNFKEQANKLLYDLGLLEELNNYGTPHIVGSYMMDTMAWNDLDIYVSNENMNLEKLYSLTSTILKKFKPIWYEAKQEMSDDGKTMWFQGFETTILGELWNIDIWFFDSEAIKNVEAYCNDVNKKASLNNLRQAIINIKKALIEKGLYSFDKYTSMDVYKAVLEQDISTINEFLIKYIK